MTIARRPAPVQDAPPQETVLVPPPGAATGVPTVGPGGPPFAEGPARSSAGVEPELPPGPVSVALLLPLSGPSADLAAAMLDAAQMALFDIGATEVVLLPKDTEGTPAGARRAADAALADGASLILGPLFSGSVAAVAPLAEAAGVTVVAFSSDRKVAGPGVFVMGFLPEQQVERVVTFAAEREFTRFAALAPASSYGQTVVRELRRVAVATTTDVVEVVFFPPDIQAASDVADIVRVFVNYDQRRQALLDQRALLEARDDEVSREALRRLETLDTLGEVDFDAVLVPEGGRRLLAVAPLLPFYDVVANEVKLLGTAQWESAVAEKEPSLFGGWFAAPPPEARTEFETRFTKIYGRAPPRIATLAYDAVALAGALTRASGEAGFDAGLLTDEGGFRGVDGLFRFAPDGSNERGLAVLEVTRKGLVTVSSAPKSFIGF
ncbi:MAG: penicillin-binding protein activator [Alphaproteobacteria bacterium]